VNDSTQTTLPSASTVIPFGNVGPASAITLPVLFGESEKM
jgi:hypothetical protein